MRIEARMRVGAKVRLILSCILAAGIAAAAEPGFQPLFDGKTLSGWKLIPKKNRKKGYVVENSAIVCPADGGGDLMTEREYANFILRFDFRMEPGGNNGVGIRVPAGGHAAYDGMEIQVIDHDHERYKPRLRPVQRHGSIYDVFAPEKDTLKPAGEWNQQEITADGRNVRIVLNGVQILNANLDSVSDPAVLKKHPGLARASGHIGFLGHGTRVEFRNIRIRVLP